MENAVYIWHLKQAANCMCTDAPKFVLTPSRHVGGNTLHIHNIAIYDQLWYKPMFCNYDNRGGKFLAYVSVVICGFRV